MAAVRSVFGGCVPLVLLVPYVPGESLPLLLALVGLGGAIGAGLALRPAPDPAAVEVGACPCDCTAPEDIDLRVGTTCSVLVMTGTAENARGKPVPAAPAALQ
mgnify:CR=1 FL=1